MPAPYSTLAQIYTKVRTLVRAPSPNQISDTTINNYVNTFVLYDLPSALRLWNLRQTFTFYTTPYVDVYPLGVADETANVNNQFFNFKNKYISIHEPLYIAGSRSVYTQNRDYFYGLYPQTQYINALSAMGDGLTTNFTGYLPNNGASTAFSTIIRGNVLFNSINGNNLGIGMRDVPLLTGNHLPGPVDNYPTYGELVAINSAPTGLYQATNFVNYVTGQFSVTFPSAPGNGQQIFSQCCPAQASIPQTMLEYDDTLILRPVPDKVYSVSFEVYVRPTELLATNQNPELEQWSQYIAYGAARKIFQDRMDMESLQMIEPEFRAQERFVLRRTIVQLSNQRTQTIYAQANTWPLGFFGNWNN